MINILAIGDVTSPGGLAHLHNELWRVRREENIDFCIVNGENASLISGISPEGAVDLLQSGADVITGGNHTLRNKATYTVLDDEEALLRPLNFTAEAPGHGYTVRTVDGVRILVLNAMGNVMIDPVLDSPYTAIDRILEREAGAYDIAVMDFHAEASGEKVAIGYAYDGKIQVIFGTHTHVPTADLRILPRGTGYVTDLGMCGESGGVLGMDPALVVRKMRTHLPVRFHPAAGPVVADGVIFTVNTETKKTVSVRRMTF